MEVRIADLSRPLVDVDIDLDDDGVERALRWTDMEPLDGRFTKGAAGVDFLSGDFHGPDHEEAWGVFDTGAWVGASGARRR